MFSIGQLVWGVGTNSHVLGHVHGIVDAAGYSLYIVAPLGWRPMTGVELEGYFADELRAVPRS
jgi:hypothetical protein